MTGEAPSFHISQDMEIAQPAKATAFAITHREWDTLKQAVSSIDDSNSLFHTLASALIGAGLSTLTTVLLTTFPKEQEFQRIIMWFATVLCLGIGALSLFFAKKEAKLLRKTAAQVVSQMDTLEERWPRQI